jgi:hypothetical protein
MFLDWQEIRLTREEDRGVEKIYKTEGCGEAETAGGGGGI